MTTHNLVAFYSMSGNSRGLANEIRDRSFGHIEEIREPRARRGTWGMLRTLFDSLARRSPAIEPAVRDPALYDLLLLGGPVWMGRIAAPVRAYARKYGARASRVAFFCTCGGDTRQAAAAFQELSSLCGRQPEAVLAVSSHDLASRAHEDDVRCFVSLAMASLGPAPGRGAAAPAAPFVLVGDTPQERA